MIRIIVLISYLNILLFGFGTDSVLCFHPDHGLVVENSSAKTLCQALIEDTQLNTSNFNVACIDIPLHENQAALTNPVFIPHFSANITNLPVQFFQVTIADTKISPIVSFKETVPVHIPTTILRI